MATFLTTEEAAARYPLSISYLKKLRCVGGGPPYQKLSRLVCYSADDIEAWLKSHTVRSTSEASQREEA